MNDNLNLSNEELIRYSRQITIPEFGQESQLLLKEASVLCVGAGGLGSAIILYLASAGVGTIGIIDNDSVDLSNLHRQVIHDSTTIGDLKTSSAKNRINKINPNCIVKVFEETLNSNNALEIIKEFDFVCDGTDNFPTKYLINDACVILNKPLIYGSIFKFEGQVSVFNKTSHSPNYRDLVPEPPPEGMIPSCAEGGVLGILPGIIGLIQATETIKLITKLGDCLDGRLLVFNALEMKFKELHLEKSIPNIEIKKLVDYQKFCGIENIPPDIDTLISPENLKILLESQIDQTLLVDVRSSLERNINFIENSISIPLENILDNSEINFLKEKAKLNINIILYCKSGKRSLKALDHLKKQGVYTKSLKAGIDNWNKKYLNT